MPGPPPKKNPARRNKSTTKATLKTQPTSAVKRPKLPTGQWHPMTRAWWKDVWASPMALEFVEADKHALFRLAVLMNDYWESGGATARKELAAEIRLQQQAFGLTPIDRRRLQWEVEKVEDAKAKGRKRRHRQPAGDPTDPRKQLDSAT